MNGKTLVTYFIHMIMSYKQSYFLIRLGVYFPYFTSRTQRDLSLAVLLQVTLASFLIFWLVLTMMVHFYCAMVNTRIAIRATQTSLAMWDTKHVNHYKTSPAM